MNPKFVVVVDVDSQERFEQLAQLLIDNGFCRFAIHDRETPKVIEEKPPNSECAESIWDVLAELLNARKRLEPVEPLIVKLLNCKFPSEEAELDKVLDKLTNATTPEMLAELCKAKIEQDGEMSPFRAALLKKTESRNLFTDDFVAQLYLNKLVPAKFVLDRIAGWFSAIATESDDLPYSIVNDIPRGLSLIEKTGAQLDKESPAHLDVWFVRLEEVLPNLCIWTRNSVRDLIELRTNNWIYKRKASDIMYAIYCLKYLSPSPDTVAELLEIAGAEKYARPTLEDVYELALRLIAHTDHCWLTHLLRLSLIGPLEKAAFINGAIKFCSANQDDWSGTCRWLKEMLGDQAHHQVLSLSLEDLRPVCMAGDPTGKNFADLSNAMEPEELNGH